MQITTKRTGSQLTASLSGELDSSGIGVILGRYRIMRERGGTLRVSAMSSYAARILKMAGILPLIGQQEGQRDGKRGTKHA